MENSPTWIAREIESQMGPRRRGEDLEDYWDRPLAGIAAAADPLFHHLREVVTPDHALPTELLPGARSVLVYFLPFKRFLAKENNSQPFFAARSWAEAYVATNRLIDAVNRHLQRRLAEAGHRTATTPATHNFDPTRLVSRWSHKHIAFIAGLGTFGHHHLLITPAGSCGRLGSLVTTLELPAGNRPLEELCLSRAGRPCHACVAKCRYGALHTDHFDRHACYRQLLRNDEHHGDLPLVDVCGKCSCEVPCSHGNPVADGNGGAEVMVKRDPSSDPL
jgi:epoxyqueuosine reductase QueG